ATRPSTPRSRAVSVQKAQSRRPPPGDFTILTAMRDWPSTVEVAPSILSADFGRMREQVAEVMDAGARVIHIDVMDGHFVPVITFGPKMVEDIAGAIHERGGFADVHLMIEQPERHIAQFAAAGHARPR